LDLGGERAEELAGVFVEPLAGFGIGAIAAQRDWLAALRDLTAKRGILLIFDEIVTGFRLGLGGASSWFGVRPDLGAIGKIVGGGFPVGGVGGGGGGLGKGGTPTKGAPAVGEEIFFSGAVSGEPARLRGGGPGRARARCAS